MTLDSERKFLPGVIGRIEAMLAAIPHALPLLALRIAIAVPFYKSGLTKWDGFLQLSNGARYLFTQEFKLHIFGNLVAYPYPIAAATLAGIGEIVLPILLVLGIGTRFAALGILAMTAVIQITVPEGWANFHLPWAAMALMLVVFGGGAISLDRLLGRSAR
ncbi:MAG: DoxX family protein [Alphaproteobacteria bacterium]|nr:DoxX family protein [Alphaproteobacteria bacterium]MBU0802438.1 DoxX family protein [Alphaproteobacteria bacterium]MBU0870120.1 DoxX family protein [Alphaproteobacteria bacterium]MBU1399937.1 DoxX family protein [Alphaproteobacteria bacterium]MBU1590323.1 DoxX family protein [Alphaproteobacteria bacterium]